MGDSSSLIGVTGGLEADLSWSGPAGPRTLSGLLRTVDGKCRNFTIAAEPVEPLPGRVDFRIRVGSVLLTAGRGECRKSAGGLELVSSRCWPSETARRRARFLPFLEAEGAGRPEDLAWRDWVENCLRLSRLVQVARGINTSDHLGKLAEIMEATKEIMEAEASSLMLLDQVTGELEIAVPTGPASAEISGIRIPAGKGFGGWVVGTGEALRVEEPEKDDRFFGEVTQGAFRTRNLVCVPLRNSEGKITGVLQALNRRRGSFTEDDTLLLLGLADHAAIAIEKLRLHRESLEKQKLEKELSLAEAIQRGFWPEVMPGVPGFDLAGSSRPATHVGGDYYDALDLGNQSCGLVIADISGKGFGAALLMAALRSALRAQIQNRQPVDETISLVNNIFVDDSPSNKFVTLFYGELDPSSNILRFVNAGHNPPLLYRSSYGTFDELNEGGPIVGFRKDLPFQSGTATFGPGDLLVLYTDGVVEAQNSSEEMFGEERLQQLIVENRQSSAREILETISREVESFSAGEPQFDDITILVCRKAP